MDKCFRVLVGLLLAGFGACAVWLVVALAIVVISATAEAQEPQGPGWPYCDDEVPENYYRPRTTPPVAFASGAGWYPSIAFGAERFQEVLLSQSAGRPYWDGHVPESCSWHSSNEYWRFQVNYCTNPGGAGSCQLRDFAEQYCPPGQTALADNGSGCFPYEDQEDSWRDFLGDGSGVQWECQAGTRQRVYLPWDSTTYPDPDDDPGLDEGQTVCYFGCSGEIDEGGALGEFEGAVTACVGDTCGRPVLLTGDRCDGSEDVGEGEVGEEPGGTVEALLRRIHQRQGQQVAVAGGVGAAMVGGLAAVANQISNLEGGGGGGTGTASGGETCEAPPTCDGDEIQCAQLRQQWEARCADVSSETVGSFLEELGLDGMGFEDLIDEDASVEDLSELLEEDGWLGPLRPCPADVTLDLGEMVGEVQVPLSMLCPLLEITGWLVVFFAGVAAIRIFGGAF